MLYQVAAVNAGTLMFHEYNRMSPRLYPLMANVLAEKFSSFVASSSLFVFAAKLYVFSTVSPDGESATDCNDWAVKFSMLCG